MTITYPSASAMEYANGRVYLMGDDAVQLLILDSSLRIFDSVLFYPNVDSPAPKSTKADIESMAILDGKLLLAGSGSLKPYRYNGWLMDLKTYLKDSISLDTFYDRLSYHGIAETNIEGITAIPNAIILANRGNKTHRHNKLIFTSPDFYLQQSKAFINSALIGYTEDSSEFQGISGMDYGPKRDQLIMIVSTEDTHYAQDDGEIGKSYIWVVQSISSKTRWKAINPDRIIDLENIDERLRKQKIESVCILEETKKFTYLLLCADNDHGKSTLFKVALRN